MKNTLVWTACVAAILTAPVPAIAADLTGATVVISNTFQGAQTKNVETDVTAFGLVNNTFAKVSDGMEFPQFITLYNVDVAADAIAFTWITSKMADKLSGPTPAGNHDRNYLTFDLPAGTSITAIEFDAEGSDLLDGSAAPTAMAIGGNKVVVDFAEGVVRGVGFNPRFKVTTTSQ